MPTAATPTADLRDEQVTAAVDRFIRNANHTVRREIEKAVRNAIASGTLKATDSLPAAITLSSDKVGLAVTIHGRIEL
jgi:hypothetical protein